LLCACSKALPSAHFLPSLKQEVITSLLASTGNDTPQALIEVATVSAGIACQALITQSTMSLPLFEGAFNRWGVYWKY